MVIKLEAVVQDSLHLSSLLAGVIPSLICLHHLKLDVQVAIRLVSDGHG